jgi:hypothetical protein
MILSFPQLFFLNFLFQGKRSSTGGKQQDAHYEKILLTARYIYWLPHFKLFKMNF